MDPQDHMGPTGVLTDVATRLHTVEALRPVRLPPTAHRVPLAANATTVTSILTSLHPTIHPFLKTRNATALQADCSLTYAEKNIYLPTSF